MGPAGPKIRASYSGHSGFWGVPGMVGGVGGGQGSPGKSSVCGHVPEEMEVLCTEYSATG